LICQRSGPCGGDGVSGGQTERNTLIGGLSRDRRRNEGSRRRSGGRARCGCTAEKMKHQQGRERDTGFPCKIKPGPWMRQRETQRRLDHSRVILQSGFAFGGTTFVVLINSRRLCRSCGGCRGRRGVRGFWGRWR
jgi:hypothetical protein